MRSVLRSAGWRKPIKMTSQPANTIATSQTVQAPQGPYRAENYTRRADHTANTSQEEQDSYILALHTDPEHHERLTALRTQYFPPNLNKLSAHIALFRALPRSNLPTIGADIVALTRTQQSFAIATGKPFLLSHGVAIDAHAPPATAIYNDLKGKWERFLSTQDKSFKAHYTIQNKAEDGVPQKTLEELQRNFEGSRGQVDGLSLFRYHKGYWVHVKDFMFTQSADS